MLKSPGSVAGREGGTRWVASRIVLVFGAESQATETFHVIAGVSSAACIAVPVASPPIGG